MPDDLRGVVAELRRLESEATHDSVLYAERPEYLIGGWVYLSEHDNDFLHAMKRHLPALLDAAERGAEAEYPEIGSNGGGVPCCACGHIVDWKGRCACDGDKYLGIRGSPAPPCEPDAAERGAEAEAELVQVESDLARGLNNAEALGVILAHGDRALERLRAVLRRMLEPRLEPPDGAET